MWDLPREHDEAIQSVPGVPKVRRFPPEAHRSHFDDHFDGKEGKDSVVKTVEDFTPHCHTIHTVFTWLIHAEGDAVDEDDQHAYPLKPRKVGGREVKENMTIVWKMHEDLERKYTQNCSHGH